MEFELMPPDVAPEFIHRLEVALSSVRMIAYLCIIGGVFALMFMLIGAWELGNGVLNMAHVSFLVGGAICFAIGLGLLGCSEAARQAGSVWMLAWGIVELVVGFTAAWQGQMLIGIFCMVGGATQVVFADLLHLPAEVFVCAYAGGELTPVLIQEGILRGQDDAQHRGMGEFVASARVAGPAVAVETGPV